MNECRQSVLGGCRRSARGTARAQRSGVPLHDTGGVHVPVGIGRAPELNPPTDSVAVYCNVNMVLRLPCPVPPSTRDRPCVCTLFCLLSAFGRPTASNSEESAPAKAEKGLPLQVRLERAEPERARRQQRRQRWNRNTQTNPRSEHANGPTARGMDATRRLCLRGHWPSSARTNLIGLSVEGTVVRARSASLRACRSGVMWSVCPACMARRWHGAHWKNAVERAAIVGNWLSRPNAPCACTVVNR